MGFSCWAIMGFIIGGALGPIQSIFPLFVVLCGIFNSSGEMGPGLETFLCASESFPTPLRGHCLGFTAVTCKAGAAIDTQVVTPTQNSFEDTFKGSQAVFIIGAGFAIAGGLVSWFMVPDKEKDLESEDKRFCEFLASNGYDTSDYGESLVEQVKSTVFKKQVLKRGKIDDNVVQKSLALLYDIKTCV